MLLIAVLLAYFAVLFGISHFASRGKRESNDSFFMAGRNASWWVVSIGMIGASVSGVSFLSVPGMVSSIGFQYIQTALGFVLGYILIAQVLLPVYYRLKSPSIYEYLNERFGHNAYWTGALFFLIAKLAGTAAKVYVIVLVLHSLAFAGMGVPFALSVTIIVAMIWLYTRKGGMNTIVWTDMAQTILIVLALVLIIAFFVQELQLDFAELTSLTLNSQWSTFFEFDDWKSTQHFAKQFFSGAFIALVMTGLDQDMIQKNRAIRTLKQSQKNMYCYGSAFVPLNFLFLLLGLLILQYATVNGIALPEQPDSYLPFLVSNGHFGTFTSACFVVGIVAATFSSADSSLTALTTSFCVDIAEKKDSVKLRKTVHIIFCALLLVAIIAIRELNSNSLIDLIYKIVSYTYGPLLGLFSFGLFTRRKACDRTIPYIAITSPIICASINITSTNLWNYQFGYELLILNGAITFLALFFSSEK